MTSTRSSQRLNSRIRLGNEVKQARRPSVLNSQVPTRATRTRRTTVPSLPGAVRGRSGTARSDPSFTSGSTLVETETLEKETITAHNQQLPEGKRRGGRAWTMDGDASVASKAPRLARSGRRHSSTNLGADTSSPHRYKKSFSEPLDDRSEIPAAGIKSMARAKHRNPEPLDPDSELQAIISKGAESDSVNDSSPDRARPPRSSRLKAPLAWAPLVSGAPIHGHSTRARALHSQPASTRARRSRRDVGLSRPYKSPSRLKALTRAHSQPKRSAKLERLNTQRPPMDIPAGPKLRESECSQTNDNSRRSVPRLLAVSRDDPCASSADHSRSCDGPNCISSPSSMLPYKRENSDLDKVFIEQSNNGHFSATGPTSDAYPAELDMDAPRQSYVEALSTRAPDDLLPSSRFPHFDWIQDFYIWTDADEAALQTAELPWVIAMAQRGERNNAELSLWKVSVDMFSCLPHELFHYGLHFDQSRCEKICYGPEKLKNLNMTQNACSDMQELMCHPVWDGQIALLRHALQMAVYFRIQGHEAPLGPTTRQGTDDQDGVFKYLAGTNEMGLLGEYYYQLYAQAGPHADKDMRQLSSRLSKCVKPRPARSEQERKLFIMNTGDIKAVRTVLDSIECQYAKRWRPTHEYCEDYRKRVKDVRHKQPPQNMAILSQWKRHCFLAKKRERAIRERLRERGFGDYLFDIPARDPMPFYFQSRRLSQGQQEVLRGVVYPPDEEPLPAPRQGGSDVET